MDEMTFTCECGQEDPAYGETYKRRLCQDCLKEFVAKLEAEIERLRAEKQQMLNDPDSYLHRMYLTCRNKTFLDAAKMVESHECPADCKCGKFIIADDLRRAAEGVKDDV